MNKPLRPELGVPPTGKNLTSVIALRSSIFVHIQTSGDYNVFVTSLTRSLFSVSDAACYHDDIKYSLLSFPHICPGVNWFRFNECKSVFISGKQSER